MARTIYDTSTISKAVYMSGQTEFLRIGTDDMDTNDVTRWGSWDTDWRGKGCGKHDFIARRSGVRRIQRLLNLSLVDFLMLLACDEGIFTCHYRSFS